VKAGLVACGDDKCFKLTQKGKRFLERFSEYHKSREVVEETLDQVKDQKIMLEQMCPSGKVVNAAEGCVEKDND
jgi:hypothetical protein